MIARQADRAVGELGKESSEWRGRQIGKWWRLEALVGVGFGEEKIKHSDSNKALKVQNPADGVLTLIADVVLMMKRLKSTLMAIVAIGGFYGLLRICDFGAASRNGWIVIQARVYYDAKRIAGKSLTEQQLSNAIAGIKLKWPITEFEPHITYFNETNWMVRLIPTKPNPLNWSILLEPTLWNYSRAQFSTIEIRSNGSAQQGSGAYVDPRRVNEAHR